MLATTRLVDDGRQLKEQAMSGGTVFTVQRPTRSMRNVEPKALVYDRAHSIAVLLPLADVAHLFQPGELTVRVDGYKDRKGWVRLKHRLR
ncbi:MAG TPA: hypothetical protein VLK85_11110 [Ramlibacter sp.]|nr:hypothetical protein [Ramlibacter sp.]